MDVTALRVKSPEDKAQASNLHHHDHHSTNPHKQRSVLVIGNLTNEQLQRVREAIASAVGDVQYCTFSHQPPPCKESQVGDDACSTAPDLPGRPHTPHNPLEGINLSKPAIMQVNTGLESMCRKLQSITKLENKVVKAVSAVSHYQKQQQDLADNFVRLSNKYQELKGHFHTVLWAHMPRLSEFSTIPVLDVQLQETEDQVGAFAVGVAVGKGHFAEVKVCSMPHDERRMVIKAIDKQRVKNVNGLMRIAHEIEALRVLRHPNILTLFSVLHGKQHVYLVTERLQSDLYEFIGEHPNGVGESLAKRVINPILEAVVFMHSKGFVHRDLKPENILLDYIGSASSSPDFIIKVCDFGLCEKIPADNTLLTEFCGSPGFMAPEMVIDRQYDGRKADLWSVGCILLELLLTAKEFSTIWMKNFQDEFMEDGVRFKRQLLGSWSQLEVALKPRISEDLYGLVCGIVRIDANQRLSTHDLQRVASRCGLLLSGGIPSKSTPGGTPPLLGRSLSSGSPTSACTSPQAVYTASCASGGAPSGCGDLQPSPPEIVGAKLQPPTSSSPSSSSSASSTSSAAKIVRPRPVAKQGSARSSLRAQTLIKLDNVQQYNAQQYNNGFTRGRNPGLGPLSPATPDVGLAKRFFGDDPIPRDSGSCRSMSPSSTPPGPGSLTPTGSVRSSPCLVASVGSRRSTASPSAFSPVVGRSKEEL